MCQKKKKLSPKQISIIYALEADVLNIALFGMTAKQWRDRDGAYLIPMKDDKIGVVKTSKGYFLLGGGLDSGESHEECITRECLEEAGQKILDYMGSTELIANLFRISQTEEKLRKDNVTGAEVATSVHYNVG